MRKSWLKHLLPIWPPPSPYSHRRRGKQQVFPPTLSSIFSFFSRPLSLVGVRKEREKLLAAKRDQDGWALLLLLYLGKNEWASSVPPQIRERRGGEEVQIGWEGREGVRMFFSLPSRRATQYVPIRGGGRKNTQSTLERELYHKCWRRKTRFCY